MHNINLKSDITILLISYLNKYFEKCTPQVATICGLKNMTRKCHQSLKDGMTK